MADIGLVGLGVMGANLALNMAEKGYSVAVFNRTAEKTDAFVANAGSLAERLTPEEYVMSLEEEGYPSSSTGTGSSLSATPTQQETID